MIKLLLFRIGPPDDHSNLNISCGMTQPYKARQGIANSSGGPVVAHPLRAPRVLRR
jgi:hypothetical protein